METVDVLRPLSLGKLGLRPRELEPVVRELLVERGLRRSHEIGFGPRLECPALDERNALDAPAPNADRLQLDLELGDLGMRGEPGRRGCAYPARFLRVNHLQRVTEVRAALLLHLDDDDAAAASKHEVELVPTHVCVRVEQAIPTQPVVEEGAALAAVHAATSW
jgi:hypothetical protein